MCECASMDAHDNHKNQLSLRFQNAGKVDFCILLVVVVVVAAVVVVVVVVAVTRKYISTYSIYTT